MEYRLTRQEVDDRRRHLAVLQDQDGVTAAKLGRLWSETVMEILVRLFEENLPLHVPCRFALCVVGSLTRREACPSSDVDGFLLVERATPEIRKHFAETVKKVAETLATGFRGAQNGLHFCSGGLSPVHLMDTPANLLREIEGLSTINDHLLGVRESTFLYGYEPLHDTFRTLVDAWFAEREAAGGQSVLDRLDRLVRDTQRSKEIPTADHFTEAVPRGDLNIKDVLLRPFQQFAALLASRFGVTATSSRDRVEQLIRRGHLSNANGWLLINSLEDLEKMRTRHHLAANREWDQIWINHPELGQKIRRYGTINEVHLQNFHLATNQEIAAIWACTQRLRHLLALGREFVDEERRFNQEMAARPTNWFVRKPPVKPAKNPFVTSDRAFVQVALPKKSVAEGTVGSGLDFRLLGGDGGVRS
jgi:hypothetical protein